MTSIIDILRFTAIGVVLLIIAHLLKARVIKSHLVPGVGFAISIVCYLLVDWPAMQGEVLFYPLLAGAFSVPFFFWLFSRSLFDDQFQLASWMWFLLATIVIVEYILFGITYESFWPSINNWEPVSWIVMHSISLLFVVLGIIAASNNWKSDLIEARIRFRSIFILFSAILIILTLLAEIAFQRNEAPGWLEFLQKLVIVLLAYYFALFRLELTSGFFLVFQPEEDQPATTKIDPSLINQLNRLIEEEKIWRTEGLTIGHLATKMNVKEYKLRQAINKHLEFRNFNDFLNRYRIEAATNILSDPSRKEVTILEIAYELGYNSLSPFNKAFKKQTGMTPTAWRKENLT